MGGAHLGFGELPEDAGCHEPDQQADDGQHHEHFDEGEAGLGCRDGPGPTQAVPQLGFGSGGWVHLFLEAHYRTAWLTLTRADMIVTIRPPIRPAMARIAAGPIMAETVSSRFSSWTA